MKSRVLLAGIVGWAIIVSVGRSDEVIATSVKLKSQEAASGPGVIQFGLTRADFERIVKLIPTAKDAMPTRVMKESARYGGQEIDVQMVGAVDQLAKRDRLSIKAGRFLTREDVKKRNNVAVIDSRVAAQLFKGESPINRFVRVDKQYFTVVGVEDRANEQGLARMFIPLTTMQARYGDTVLRRAAGQFSAERYELSSIRIQLKDASQSEQVRAATESVLRRFHESKDYTVKVRAKR